MKIKKYLSLAALAFIGLGSAVGLLNHKDNLVKASAAEETTTKVTVKWNVKGAEAPASLNCYSWNDASGNNNGAWPGTPVSKAADSDSYVFEIPNKIGDADTDRVIFNDGTSQSENLVFSSFLKNLSAHQKGSVSFTISSLSNKTYNGTWYAHTTSEFKYTSDYCKIWLDRKEADSASSYLTPLLVYTTTENKEVTVWPSSYVATYEGSSRYLVGYDVLKNEIVGASYKFSLTDIYWGTNRGETPAQKYESGANAKLHYLNGYNKESSQQTSLNFSTGRAASGENQLGAAYIVKEVFAGYFTCSSDKDNGYGNFATLADTWVKGLVDEKETWWVSGSLGDVTVDDYATEDGYATGTGKTYSTNLWDKFSIMEAGYNSISGLSLSNSLTINFANNTTLIFLSISTIFAVIVCFVAVRIYKFRKR